MSKGVQISSPKLKTPNPRDLDNSKYHAFTNFANDGFRTRRKRVVGETYQIPVAEDDWDMKAVPQPPGVALSDMATYV